MLRLFVLPPPFGLQQCVLGVSIYLCTLIDFTSVLQICSNKDIFPCYGLANYRRGWGTLLREGLDARIP